MRSTHILYVVAGILSPLMTILYVGQFYDPDDGDRTFFIKHKPVFKQLFYSPKAYYRLHPRTLTLAEEQEERAYQEYKKDMTDASSAVLPIVFIQISLTLFTAGLYTLMFRSDLKYWQLLLQFVINIFVTPFVLIYILMADTSVVTWVFVFILLIVNMLIFGMLEKVKHRWWPVK